MDMLIYILIGAFVGWNFPQPFWARIIQAKLVDMFTKKS